LAQLTSVAGTLRISDASSTRDKFEDKATVELNEPAEYKGLKTTYTEVGLDPVSTISTPTPKQKVTFKVKSCRQKLKRLAEAYDVKFVFLLLRD